MNLYEIVNPSDPITLEAPDDLTARFAALLLGSGRYGVTNEKGESIGTFFLFGATEEALKKDGLDLEALKADRDALERLATALESAAVCSLTDRRALRAALGDDPKALERWNESKRSSLNNICKAARVWAESLRQHAANAAKLGASS